MTALRERGLDAAAAQALLVTAMGDEVRYSRFLNDLSLSVPGNVWIRTITLQFLHCRRV